MSSVFIPTPRFVINRREESLSQNYKIDQMNKEKFAPGSKAFNPASHARGQNFDKCPSSPRSPILSIDNDQWLQDYNNYIFECIDVLGTEEVSNCFDLFSIRNSTNSTIKNRRRVAPKHKKECKDLIRKNPHCIQCGSIKRSKSNPIFLERGIDASKHSERGMNKKFKKVRFSKEIVTEIRYRPATDEKDWNKLYYSNHELQRMRDSNTRQKKQIIIADEIDLDLL